MFCFILFCFPVFFLSGGATKLEQPLQGRAVERVSTAKAVFSPGLHTSHRLSLHLPGVSRLENNKLSRCIFSFPLSLSLTSSVTTSFWNVLKDVDRNTRSVCLPLVGVAGLGTEAESRTELTRLTSVWGWQWECIWNLPGQAWELKQISTQVPHLPPLPPSTSYFPPPPAA